VPALQQESTRIGARSTVDSAAGRELPADAYVPTDVDIAWAAGLFEGEGCWSGSPMYRRYGLANLTMTDEDIVRKFARIVGVGRVYERQSIQRKQDGEMRKRAWTWRTNTVSEFLEVAYLLGSHMGSRRSLRMTQLVNDLPLVTSENNGHNWARLA
jgi:hypothetical protein